MACREGGAFIAKMRFAQAGINLGHAASVAGRAAPVK
jgi:hypothetical protein